MIEVTVESFSRSLKLPVEKLIKQLDSAGVSGKNPEDILSDAEKRKLLDFLRKSHGAHDGAAVQKISVTRKITLRRKPPGASTLRAKRAGSSVGGVDVQIRKKKVIRQQEVSGTEELEKRKRIEKRKQEREKEEQLRAKLERERKQIQAGKREAEEKVQAEKKKKEEAASKRGEEKNLTGKEAPAAKKNDKRKKNETRDKREKKQAREEIKISRPRRKTRKPQPARGGGKTISSAVEHGFTKPTEPVVREVPIPETVTVGELAQKMSVKAGELLKVMMNNGIMATINDTIDHETAFILVEEMGHKPVAALETSIEEEVLNIEGLADGELISRAPVVTIMGHVDHGKTTLLDYIRKSQVAKGEAGGITQHIGAYKVDTDHGEIVFLDTPGHAAFSAMRARGAKVTDIVIVLVAADDGIMPQTIEAVQHAKAAGVPMIVAINKIDKEESDPKRVKSELASQDVTPEDWGGDVPFVQVSAHSGQGVDDLLENVSLVAELLELKALAKSAARGVVIESRIDRGKGAVSTVLVQSGKLKKGNVLIAGREYGKIRSMTNENGKDLSEVGPSTPVEVLGLSGCPEAGEEAVVVERERKARELADYRSSKQRDIKLAKQKQAGLERMFDKMEQGDLKEINILVKADVHGSAEAIRDSLEKLSNDEVKVNVISLGVGGINESDINLATVSNAVAIGFNVRADATAKKIAAREGITIEYFSIIYDLIDQIKNLVTGKMSSEFKDEIIGIAEVRDVFRASKIGAVAGCLVVEGTVKRNNPIRVLRDNVVIYEGELESLRRFKDDVNEVRSGTECGIGVKNYNDVKIGDQIEVYERVEIKRSA